MTTLPRQTTRQLANVGIVGGQPLVYHAGLFPEDGGKGLACIWISCWEPTMTHFQADEDLDDIPHNPATVETIIADSSPEV
jgi:hypothetical protein